MQSGGRERDREMGRDEGGIGTESRKEKRREEGVGEGERGGVYSACFVLILFGTLAHRGDAALSRRVFFPQSPQLILSGNTFTGVA